MKMMQAAALAAGMRAAAAGLVLAALAGSAVAQNAPSIDDFFRPPDIIDAQLSPSGRYLAVVIGSPTVRAHLAVLDLDQRSTPAKGVARLEREDVAGVRWVNDERLVFSATDRERPLARQRYEGLWAVDRDGSDVRALVKQRYTPAVTEGNSRIVRRLLEPNHLLLDVANDDSDDVILEQYRWNERGDPIGTTLHRLNTRTGAIRAVATAPDSFVHRWVLDHQGEPRAAHSFSEGRERVFARAGDAWTLLRDAPEDAKGDFSPIRLADDGKNLLVLAAHGPDGVGALFRYDVADKKLQPEPIFSIDGFDYDGAMLEDRKTGRLLGLRYAADAEGTAWFDADMKAAQAEVDRQLPGGVNRLDCLVCSGAPRLLVVSYSDQRPATYYLFDTKTRKIEPLGGSRSWIDPRRMAQQDFVRIKARDGLSLPIYVTKPAGKSAAPRPAVVLVHGGPQLRGNVWGWRDEAQFLASRGYVVIEPEFRGGDGFGYRHLSAGFKQWGLAMQDDVTDATQWAIKEAGVDPKRICIAGASYGGYATLMGLVREPALYRCGINWVGVTDLSLLLSANWSDLSSDTVQYSLPRMIGDPVKDKERFEQTSPIAQAHRITQPLLMAYGGIDRRVPIEHGTRFRDAVTKVNKDVEWVVYPDEGHYFFALATRIDFWGRVEKFLARHIGPSAAVADATAPAAR